ncbi:unnamed protein product [Closterium sp. NIES-64]|nr:unnamed protein product [Closterium sp. NIES-64]
MTASDLTQQQQGHDLPWPLVPLTPITTTRPSSYSIGDIHAVVLPALTVALDVACTCDRYSQVASECRTAMRFLSASGSAVIGGLGGVTESPEDKAIARRLVFEEEGDEEDKVEEEEGVGEGGRGEEEIEEKEEEQAEQGKASIQAQSHAQFRANATGNSRAASRCTEGGRCGACRRRGGEVPYTVFDTSCLVDSSRGEIPPVEAEALLRPLLSACAAAAAEKASIAPGLAVAAAAATADFPLGATVPSAEHGATSGARSGADFSPRRGKAEVVSAGSMAVAALESFQELLMMGAIRGCIGDRRCACVGGRLERVVAFGDCVVRPTDKVTRNDGGAGGDADLGPGARSSRGALDGECEASMTSSSREGKRESRSSSGSSGARSSGVGGGGVAGRILDAVCLCAGLPPIVHPASSSSSTRPAHILPPPPSGLHVPNVLQSSTAPTAATAGAAAAATASAVTSLQYQAVRTFLAFACAPSLRLHASVLLSLFHRLFSLRLSPLPIPHPLPLSPPLTLAPTSVHLHPRPPTARVRPLSLRSGSKHAQSSLLVSEVAPASLASRREVMALVRGEREELGRPKGAVRRNDRFSRRGEEGLGESDWEWVQQQLVLALGQHGGTVGGSEGRDWDAVEACGSLGKGGKEEAARGGCAGVCMGEAGEGAVCGYDGVWSGRVGNLDRVDARFMLAQAGGGGEVTGGVEREVAGKEMGFKQSGVMKDLCHLAVHGRTGRGRRGHCGQKSQEAEESEEVAEQVCEEDQIGDERQGGEGEQVGEEEVRVAAMELLCWVVETSAPHLASHPRLVNALKDSLCFFLISNAPFLCALRALLTLPQLCLDLFLNHDCCPGGGDLVLSPISYDPHRIAALSAFASLLRSLGNWSSARLEDGSAKRGREAGELGEGQREDETGSYLGERGPHAAAVLAAYMDSFDLRGLELDEAIRMVLQWFRLPGEAQKIERVMEALAAHYCCCNPGGALSGRLSTAHVLAYSIGMLNMDAHSPCGLELDEAIRVVLQWFRLPGEAQKIERVMEALAARYCCCCNPGGPLSGRPSTAHVLAYSIVMLNTDAHSPCIQSLSLKAASVGGGGRG